MIESIQTCISEPKLKSILKKSISFESPSKINEEDEPEVKNTVKKGQGSQDYILRKN